MASQISFYILSPQKKLIAFVCQLIQTVLHKSDDSIIVVAASEQLPMLDDRLWSLGDVSFIPHQIIESIDVFNQQKLAASVVITDNVALVQNFDGVVINLTHAPILDTQASRLLEVIDATPSNVENGRHKYRAYQTHLQPLVTNHPQGSVQAIQVFQIQ